MSITRTPIPSALPSAAVEHMAKDDNDKFLLLRRTKGSVHSTTVVDEEALDAFERDGVIQVKGCIDDTMIDEVHLDIYSVEC